MKLLFIIQGEGRGHFTQALVMQELARSRGDEVVACLVGKSEHRRLPEYFLSKMKTPVEPFVSPNFLPTAQNKRPNLLKSTLYNLVRLPRYISGMKFIKDKIREYQPDIVINFYELLTGLTYFFISPQVPMVCIGHQYMFLHRKFRFKKTFSIPMFSLRFFTRMTSLGASRKLALSFYPMPDDYKRGVIVVPPLLRKEVTQLPITDGDYIHGYVLNSGYIEEIKKWHQVHPDTKLDFFWDKQEAPSEMVVDASFSLHRIDDKKFLHYMAGCKAYSTTAGFESVCEALYLQKPVLMVPVHIEQECNAFDAMKAGAGIVSDTFDLNKLLDFIPDYKKNTAFRRWVANADPLIFSELQAVYDAMLYPADIHTFSLNNR